MSTIVIDSIPQPANRVRQYWGDRPMGEVRVDVRLINATDVSLAVARRLPPDQIRAYAANAMVDTGAVCTVVPQHVVDQLGLTVVGHRVATMADGTRSTVDVVAPIQIEILGRSTFEEALVLGDEVLIGQTVLEKTDLLVDCANARIVPNPAHPDQPITKLKGIRAVTHL
jgi:clan AA aspartic protease